MAIVLRRARPARPEQVRRHTRAAICALLVLCVLMVVAVLLGQAAARAVRAQSGLSAVASDLYAQDAMTWRAVSGRTDDVTALVWLNTSRARTVTKITGLDAPGLTSRQVRDLLTSYRAYAQAVDHELQLLGDNENQMVDADGQQSVDLAYNQTRRQIRTLSGQMSRKAARAERIADAGVAGTFVAAVLMIGLLASGRRLSQIVAETQARGVLRYRMLAAESPVIVVVMRRDGLVTFLSPAAERMLEVEPANTGLLEKGSEVMLERIHPGDRTLLLTSVLSARPDSRGLRTELRLRAAEGQSGEKDETGLWRTYEVSFRDHTDQPGVEGVLLTAHDVTEQRELQNEIHRRALHDDLTGLPNRALLTDRIQQALRDGSRHGFPIGLLIIDLDRFKEINDTLGHHYGDELLIQVGQALQRALRDVDTVARLGGDEFAVLLPQVSDLNAACAVAWKLHDTLEGSFVVEGVELDVEASIGVTISEQAAQDSAAGLLQRADVAMYVAKGRSIGVAGYDPLDDVNTIERLALLGDLRRALSNDELYLVYQPKISLTDGALGSVEALLRWKHPERGLVPPDAFIPLAENTGLIGHLTRHVLDLALAQSRAWMDAGTPLRIAVNTSARNLHDEEFDRTVRGLLTRHGVEPSMLLLEVTESALMADPVRARQLLQRLAAQGIAISIDDFGAGYTSIKQLRSLPITELKVDQSFVQAMEQDEGEELIVRSVIELGRNLGLTTVAEGVETPQALVKLASFGCDVAQGYVLARPMTAPDLDHWRSQWRGLAALISA
ncbi:hypothetical protein GCM10022223_27380 [Kineosporia mesophila]|uniref:Uncharacterized protein n=1 Tax=Kineosporia mesophila TaxID=566012 RepID=A0ABP6ZHD2_9ACTN|nr:EAL domain-containing protein [Kineosporia mesophila]MCD5353527.1 EAL domain-containing protein [Kineosporia mesophila]